MRWYLRTYDLVLKDGTTEKEYHYVIETRSVEIAKAIEKFFKKLIDYCAEKRIG